jgi:hypothetical protein
MFNDLYYKIGIINSDEYYFNLLIKLIIYKIASNRNILEYYPN